MIKLFASVKKKPLLKIIKLFSIFEICFCFCQTSKVAVVKKAGGVKLGGGDKWEKSLKPFVLKIIFEFKKIYDIFWGRATVM